MFLVQRCTKTGARIGIQLMTCKSLQLRRFGRPESKTKLFENQFYTGMGTKKKEVVLPVDIPVLLREIDGSRQCRNLRRKGEILLIFPYSFFINVRSLIIYLYAFNSQEHLIPSSFYGVNNEGVNFNTKIMISEKIVLREMRVRGVELENTLYRIDIEGKTNHLVVARSTQINPITAAPLNICFLKFRPGITRLRVPVNYVGDDDNPELKKGNIYLARQTKFVEVTCSREEIPNSIDFSLRDAKNGDVVRASSIILPEGVKLHKNVKPDMVLAVIKSG